MTHITFPHFTYEKAAWRTKCTAHRKTSLTRIILAAIVLFAASLFWPASNAQAKTPEAPALSESAAELIAGYEDYIIRFVNVIDNADLTFSSSDKKIATVSDTGIITPVSPGKAAVNVLVRQNGGEYTLSMAVTVLEPYYEVTEYHEGVHIGGSVSFRLTRYGYKEAVSWKISGASRARLEVLSESEARLTGISEGTVYITIESGIRSDTYEVRVLEGKGNVYVVSPKSQPYGSKYKSASTYNKNTKNYYMLRSYLEQLEKDGGGTLLLKAGTYTITNILCVPSNTKILLSDGVVIDKTYDTGTSSLAAHRSIFQIVSYSDYNTYGGLTKYNGAHDVSIIGEGSASVRLNGLDTCAIVMCHNRNVLISGISFYDMRENHFIELDASDNVTIRDCLFQGHIASATGRKEAINIDNPDRETRGFNQNWTSYDGTPNSNIYIENNVFIDLESAIGTHKYTEGKIHKNIYVTDNLFYNMNAYAIRAMNWEKVNIEHNVFYNHPDYSSNVTAVIMNGVTLPSVTENRFENYAFMISAYHWKNSGYGSIYAPIYNVFTDGDFTEMSRNYVLNVDNPYVEYYNKLDDWKDIRKEYVPKLYELEW